MGHHSIEVVKNDTIWRIWYAHTSSSRHNPSIEYIFSKKKRTPNTGKKYFFNKTFIFVLHATSSSKEHASLLWRHDSCSKMHALLWRHNSCSKMHDQTVSMYDIVLSTVWFSFLYHDIRMKVCYIITRTAIQSWRVSQMKSPPAASPSHISLSLW